MFTSLLPGFALSLTLIMAIGAQNAFVLRQGLRREHVLPVVLVCAASDAVLIMSGVAGFGALAEAAPWFGPLMRYGGAAFLLWYGWRNAVSAWQGGEALEAEGQSTRSLRKAILTLLALTWLNPHVYLDTLVLLGSTLSQLLSHFSLPASSSPQSSKHGPLRISTFCTPLSQPSASSENMCHPEMTCT